MAIGQSAVESCGRSLECRACKTALRHTFCDLGETPFANSYLKNKDALESVFPLHTYVCHKCFLVQLGEFQSPAQIFSEYAYFSSFSSSWVEHAKKYVETVVERFSLDGKTQVVEIASNDGYLLQHFARKKIPVLGIEPAKNVAEVAIQKGIPTRSEFFGRKCEVQADLLIANNVLAHVPDLNDFVLGLKKALNPEGILTLEFPHLLQLMKQNQFDTIYHEHFSYFSLSTVEKIFAERGLEIFDVEELPTHGGSLRIYAQHSGDKQTKGERLKRLREEEEAFSLHDLKGYVGFSSKVRQVKESLRLFFEQHKGKRIAAYGAPAKGNTLLNYCQITSKELPFTVDLSPHKQGHFLPGSRIPIYAPEKIEEYQPDYLLILPWNLKTEIQKQMQVIRKWGGKFVVPIPELRIE